jgi:hypothetical protein
LGVADRFPGSVDRRIPSAVAPQGWQPIGDPLAGGRAKLTYGGSIVFEFPNYDFVIGGTPQFAGQGNGAMRTSADPDADRDLTPSRIIMKNDQGYWWDGSNYFRSPYYHDDAFAHYNYLQRIVGRPDQQWPALPPRTDLPLPPRPLPPMLTGAYRLPGDGTPEPPPTKWLAPWQPPIVGPPQLPPTWPSRGPSLPPKAPVSWSAPLPKLP